MKNGDSTPTPIQHVQRVTVQYRQQIRPLTRIRRPLNLVNDDRRNTKPGRLLLHASLKELHRGGLLFRGVISKQEIDHRRIEINTPLTHHLTAPSEFKTSCL
jgi:hypothetical protein